MYQKWFTDNGFVKKTIIIIISSSSSNIIIYINCLVHCSVTLWCVYVCAITVG